MAWRIDEQVVRGEIDNRMRGRVTGRIWFVGLDSPIELDFEGNAWRDLAGRRLAFVNPNPIAGDLQHLARRQVGVIGDCTASRKVKVPEVSMEEFRELDWQRKPFPWHWGNSLYLEWFGARNGRVVIESASFQLTIDPEATWQMTADEEVEQRRANGAAMTSFMERLVEGTEPLGEAADDEEEGEAFDDALEAADLREEDDGESDEESWEAERPMTEAEAEAMQAESDRLADRIQARIEREGDGADLGKIIAEEIERRRRERGEQPLTPEEEVERDEWMNDVNRAAAEMLAGSDPELEAEIKRKHPLAEQAFELSLRLHREPEERHWIPDDASEEHPLVALIHAASCAGAKFAGALNGGWPPEVDLCAGKIVRLKKARGYIDDALAAIADCLDQKLAEAHWLKAAEAELVGIGTACDDIITELRGKLERGFD